MESGGSTVTAAIPGCRLLAPGGNVEMVVSGCMGCPEAGRGVSGVRMGPAVFPEDGAGSERTLAKLTGL